MKTKNFSLVLASLFLVLAFAGLTSAASVSVSLFYEDTDASTYTIIDGQNANFVISADSILEDSMNTKVQLLDSSNRVVATLIDSTTTSDEYYDTYALTTAVYPSAGTYKIKAIVTAKSGQTATNTLNLIIKANTNPNVDTTAPVITILGSNPVTLNAGTFYSDAGATARDNVDGVITSRIVVTNNVNPNVVGVYLVRYRVSDMAGNIASANRIVNVIPAGDVTAPVIVVLSPESARIYNYSNINLTVQTESNAVVQYSVDGGVFSSMTYSVASDNFNSLVNFTDGTHTVSFTATDMAGNVGTEDVTFYVNTSASGNSTFPIITVITPVDGEEYDDSEITFEVRLNKFASVVYNLDNEGNVTMSQSGSLVFTSNELDLDDDDYTVVFYATDLSGNVASQSVDFSIDTSDDDDDDKDKNSINSVTDLYKSKTASTKKPVIDLSDEEALNKLNWFQKLINWIVGLFGGEPVYK